VIGDRAGVPHDFYKLVHKAVEKAKGSWDGGDFDMGDIVARVWTYLLESPNQISKMLDMTPDQQRQTLAWIAHRECAKEYEEFLEYCGNNLYNRDDIRHLLAQGILYKDVDTFHWLPGFIHEGLDKMKSRDKIRDEHGRGATDYVGEIWARYGPEGRASSSHARRQHLVDAITRLTIEVNRAVRRHDTGRL
jgi:hypothetical protein